MNGTQMLRSRYLVLMYSFMTLATECLQVRVPLATKPLVVQMVNLKHGVRSAPLAPEASKP